MRQQQDQEQVIAAEAAAVASLTPWVKDGKFEMRNEALARWLFGPAQSLQKAVIKFLLNQPDGGHHHHLIEKAIAGDAVIDTVIREVIRKKLSANETLSPCLRQYLIFSLTDRDKRKVNGGGRPADYSLRGMAIHRAVEDVINRGFRPTRNASSADRGDESACSIVSNALAEFNITLSEKRVVAIWQLERRQLAVVAAATDAAANSSA